MVNSYDHDHHVREAASSDAEALCIYWVPSLAFPATNQRAFLIIFIITKMIIMIITIMIIS